MLTIAEDQIYVLVIFTYNLKANFSTHFIPFYWIGSLSQFSCSCLVLLHSLRCLFKKKIGASVLVVILWWLNLNMINISVDGHHNKADQQLQLHWHHYPRAAPSTSVSEGGADALRHRGPPFPARRGGFSSVNLSPFQRLLQTRVNVRLKGGPSAQRACH